MASAGLAILSHLPDRELDDYLGRVDLGEQWGAAHSTPNLIERVGQTRTSGYAINPGLIVEGSWGMAAAVFDNSGFPAWALSLTGVESRFKPARQRELGALLLSSAHQLTRALA